MRLNGKVYDFGDRSAGQHLLSISEELSEQAFINGEDNADFREVQPLYDLSALLERLANEVIRMETQLGAVRALLK